MSVLGGNLQRSVAAPSSHSENRFQVKNKAVLEVK